MMMTVVTMMMTLIMCVVVESMCSRCARQTDENDKRPESAGHCMNNPLEILLQRNDPLLNIARLQDVVFQRQVQRACAVTKDKVRDQACGR